MSRALIDYLTTPGADQSALEAALFGRIPNPASKDLTASAYTLLPADNGQIIRISDPAGVLITVPATLPAGFSCGVKQQGVGRITFQAGSGAAVDNVDGYTKSRKQKSFVTVWIEQNVAGTAANALLIGDLGA